MSTKFLPIQSLLAQRITVDGKEYIAAPVSELTEDARNSLLDLPPNRLTVTVAELGGLASLQFALEVARDFEAEARSLVADIDNHAKRLESINANDAEAVNDMHLRCGLRDENQKEREERFRRGLVALGFAPEAVAQAIAEMKANREKLS